MAHGYSFMTFCFQDVIILNLDTLLFIQSHPGFNIGQAVGIRKKTSAKMITVGCSLTLNRSGY